MKQNRLNIALALFAAVSLTPMVGCTGKTATDIAYKTYTNERLEYVVEYPDLLLPQGESENGDGQHFLSQDGKTKMTVYGSFWMDDQGDILGLEQVYRQETSRLSGMIDKQELSDNRSFLITGKGNGYEAEAGSRYRLYMRQGEDERIYTILLSYPEADKALFAAIGEHIDASLVLQTTANMDSAEEEFLSFCYYHFIDPCYLNANLYTLLRDNDERLKSFIDPKSDVQRITAPGAVSRVYSRSENFGFENMYDEERLFGYQPECGGEFNLIWGVDEEKFCELDFKTGCTGYCEWLEELPEVVVDEEHLIKKRVTIASPYDALVAVYLQDGYGGMFGCYFARIAGEWKLICIDDSFCNA